MFIRQINNLRIYRNTNNPIDREYYVKTPDGRILEEFSTLEKAVEYAKETPDFTLKCKVMR